MIRIAFPLLLAACASDPGECSQSVAEYCAANGGCPMTFDAAQDPAAWGCGSGQSGRIGVWTCDGVGVAGLSYVDTGMEFYYGADGKLYRIEAWGGALREPRCLAGGGRSVSCAPTTQVTDVCPTP